MREWRWIRIVGDTKKGADGLPMPTWELLDGADRNRASIWQNRSNFFTWHTWDAGGIGGENAHSSSLDDAKRECVASIVLQGWAPGGWKVRW